MDETALPLPYEEPAHLGFHPVRLRRITEVFERDTIKGAIPGAVILVARRGRIAYVNTVGFQDATLKTPMRVDSIFRIASMTKPVTCVAAMCLAEEGEFPLATPISRYIPEFAEIKVATETDVEGEPSLSFDRPRSKIMIQDLMRHTSGMTYGHFGDSLVHRKYRELEMMNPYQTNEEMVQKLCTLPLRYHPGTTFEYGMSVDVLGRVVEIVSGLALNTFVTERILKPLGMRDTSFGLAAEKHERLALPFPEFVSSLESACANPLTPQPRWQSGGGGMLSTAPDYLRFALMLLKSGELNGTRILAPETIKFMTSNHLPPAVEFGSTIGMFGSVAPTPQMGQGFGLGFAVRTARGQNPDMGSVGLFYWPGISGCAFWVDPPQELAVVLMLQAPTVRAHYRSLLRNLVYQALLD